MFKLNFHSVPILILITVVILVVLLALISIFAALKFRRRSQLIEKYDPDFCMKCEECERIRDECAKKNTIDRCYRQKKEEQNHNDYCKKPERVPDDEHYREYLKRKCERDETFKRNCSTKCDELDLEEEQHLEEEQQAEEQTPNTQTSPHHPPPPQQPRPPQYPQQYPQQPPYPQQYPQHPPQQPYYYR